MPESKSPIFIGGAGRSGTTLLRVMLDSHRAIACGPELKIIPHLARQWAALHNSHGRFLEQVHHYPPHELAAAYAAIIGSLLDKHRVAAGKPRAAEKTPHNVLVFPGLHALFPASPLIHVIRDGRDVVCSLLTMNWTSAETGQPLDYTQDAAKAAAYWAGCVRAGRSTPSVVPRALYYELRYEDLVSQPEATLRALLDFVEEDWDPAVLEHHQFARDLAGESSADQVARPLYQNARGRWQRDLSPEDREAVKRIAGPLLRELGYCRDLDW